MTTEAEFLEMAGKEGSFAFPCEAKMPSGAVYYTCGMTLRDWFAGQALAGILSSGDFISPEGLFSGKGDTVMADAAYILADAMIAERSRQ